MRNFKNSRKFTFKAYECEISQDVQTNAHGGKFAFASECEYYVEKFILDFFNKNFMDESIKTKKFVIYKISTIEDSNIEDLLIMQIFINEDGKIELI